MPQSPFREDSKLTLEEFDAFCESLPHTTHVVQWGDAHVWKIGWKVFAVGGWNEPKKLGVTFKCNPEVFDAYKDKPGLRPAPYLASRGMTWLQWTGAETLSVIELKEYLWQSYYLICDGLTKAKQRELGIEPKR